MTAPDALLDAGFRLFLARGFDGAGLSDILAATGLSKGAFYHHFESKQALYEEVIARFFPSPFERFDWQAHAALTAAAQKAAITAFYDEILAMGAKEAVDLNRYFALFFDSLSRLPDFRERTAKIYRQAASILAETLVREGAGSEAAAREALAFLAEREGRLVLRAVAELDPEAARESENGPLR